MRSWNDASFRRRSGPGLLGPIIGGTLGNWQLDTGAKATIVPGTDGTNNAYNDVIITSIKNKVLVNGVLTQALYPTITAGQSYTISQFSTFSGFNGRAFTIGGTLTIKGTATSTFANGQIQFGPSGVLDIQSKFNWESPDGFSLGTVLVDGGGSMTVTGGAQNLGSILSIGGAGGAGTVTFANMNNNLKLTNASIAVYAGGYLNFAQTTNSATAGGIDPASSGSIAIVGGKVERTGVTRSSLTVGVPIAIGQDAAGNGGSFVVDSNTNVSVDPAGDPGYSVIDAGGTIELQANSYVSVSAGVELTSSDSNLWVDGSDAAATTDSLLGVLNVLAGRVVIGAGETRQFTTFDIEKDFSMSGGTLVMSIKGGVGVSASDTIVVDGKLQVETAATLTIEDQNNVYPDPTEGYLLIKPKTDTDTRFGSITNLNAPVINWMSSIEGGYKIYAPAKAAAAVDIETSVDPAGLGQAVTFTATVTPSDSGNPTGLVYFFDGDSLLGAGTLSQDIMGAQATFVTSTLALGDHSITAVYAGDSTYGTNTAALTETVEQPIGTISLSADNTAPYAGQPITLTVTLGANSSTPPSGFVNFYDGTTLLGSGILTQGPLGYSATFVTSSLAMGDHSITATYSGDPNNPSVTSTALDETIQQQSSTTDLTADNYSPVAGGMVNFTATVSPDALGGSPMPSNVQDG